MTVTRSDLGREAGRPEPLALFCLAPAESMKGAECARARLRIIVDVVERRPSLWERFDAERRRSRLSDGGDPASLPGPDHVMHHKWTAPRIAPGSPRWPAGWCWLAAQSCD